MMLFYAFLLRLSRFRAISLIFCVFSVNILALFARILAISSREPSRVYTCFTKIRFLDRRILPEFGVCAKFLHIGEGSDMGYIPHIQSNNFFSYSIIRNKEYHSPPRCVKTCTEALA